jgi:hypothetical protein
MMCQCWPLLLDSQRLYLFTSVGLWKYPIRAPAHGVCKFNAMSAALYVFLLSDQLREFPVVC